MVWASLNGWTLKAKANQANLERAFHSPHGRAWSAQPTGIRRGTPRRWQGQGCLMEPECADTLDALLLGRFHRWALNVDLFSTTGLGPAPGYTATIGAIGSGRLANSRAVTITSVDFQTSLQSGKWAIGAWLYEASAWVHYWVRSDGAKWVDGVRNDAASTTWLSVAAEGGAFSIAGGVVVDEIQVIELNACDEALEAFYTWMAAGSGQAFSDAPYLVLDGDVIRNRPVEVLGKGNTVDHRIAGSLVTEGYSYKLRDVPVELEEKLHHPVKQAPNAQVAWSMDSDLEATFTLSAARGAPQADASINTLTIGSPGPWGFREAATSPIDLELPQAAFAPFYALGKLTVVAIVKTTFGADRTIVHFASPGAATMIRLYVDAGGTPFVEGRAALGDPLDFSAGASPLPDQTYFHTVCGIVDLEEEEVIVGVDGVLDPANPMTPPSQATFDDTTLLDGAIGQLVGGSDAFAGEIASVRVYPRRFTPRQFLELHELAYDRGLW